MGKITKLATALAVAGVLMGSAAARAEMMEGQHHHEAEASAAGQPGDPSAPPRRIEITVREGEGAMAFSPDRVDAKKGEQIEFVISNSGALDHEFVIGSKAENAEHAKEMASMPAMKRAEPNAVTIKAGASAHFLWKFARSGTFEYACLIPGHYEAGMKGAVVVK